MAHKENHSGGLFNHNQMGGGSTPWINPPTGPTQLAVDLEFLSRRQHKEGRLLNDLDVKVQLTNGVDLKDVLAVSIYNGVITIICEYVTWRAATNSIQSFCHTTE